MSKQTQQYISNEITRQLQIMKYQLDYEWSKDLQKLEDKYNQLFKLTEELRSEIKNQTQIINDINGMANKAQNQIVLSERMQLAAIEQTKGHIDKVTKQMGQHVYSRITNEINTKIAPKLENLVQFVNYNNQDTTELISKYRDSVQKNDNDTDNKCIISENVKFVF